MDAPIIFDPANPVHATLIPSFTDIHIACIETDHTIATFRPPLNRDAIIEWWKERAADAAAGRRIIFMTLRRSGIAKKLMEKLEEVAKIRGQTLLTLDTETGSPAETVYPKLGYIQLGIIPKYGVSPVDGSLIAAVILRTLTYLSTRLLGISSFKGKAKYSERTISDCINLGTGIRLCQPQHNQTP
ncbi:hypothetical protein DFH09DRAFT_1196181 [Mycena vulgaris]|nr:hypothetical protein DFH09DRAFT_1196181 [Mycena vulgaris]